MAYSNLFERFTCKGGECINNCCKFGWKVEIDDQTAEFYNDLKDENGRILRSFMKRTDSGAYYFPLDEVPGCPMMTKDGWCGIYQAYGEDRMSKTCQTFPRLKQFSSDAGTSLSMVTNECEEVLRMMLENEEGVRICFDDGKEAEEEKNSGLYNLLFEYVNQVVDILQNGDIPLGIAVATAFVKMMDIAPYIITGDVEAVRERIGSTDSIIREIEQVAAEFPEEALKESAWSLVSKIVVGFLDILFVSNFARYEEILPIAEKYTDKGEMRGREIIDSFEKFRVDIIQSRESFFRRLIANLFVQYTMSLGKAEARDLLLHELGPKILVSLIVPALWSNKIWADKAEFLPRLSILERIMKEGYMSKHLSPAIRSQMSLDEGAYAVMLAGIL